MVAHLDLVIGMRHGEACTCAPLDPVTVTAHPVVVSRDCRGQHEVPRSEVLAGSVVITWPRPVAGVLSAWAVTIADVDTATPWFDVINMRINGAPGRDILTADLERLVDENGTPDSTGRGKSVPTEDGTGYRTAVFRYAVAEMRVAGEA